MRSDGPEEHAIEYTLDALFARCEPVTRETFDALLEASQAAGPVIVEAKKTSIHLAGPKSAFAGVHPRKAGFVLNIRSETPIRSARIRKLEQVSAHRFHNELLLTGPSQVDAELRGWLRDAYALSC